MERAIRVLVVEDKSVDAELIILALQQGGFAPEWEQIETADELKKALLKGPSIGGAWDAVLSDYTLPMFGAEACLEIVRAADPVLPFIVVSGTVGEDTAVQIMRAGANDYVLKHNLPRLAPALDRELREAENVRARTRADDATRRSEMRYRRLFEAAQDGILIVDPISRRILDANPFLTTLMGYRWEELVGKELWELGFFGDIQANKRAFQTLREQGFIRYDNHPLFTKDGQSIDVEFVGNIFDAGDSPVIQCTIRDVTEQNRSKRELQQSHKRLRDIIDGLGPSMFVALLTPEGILIDVNQPPLTASNLKREDVLGKHFADTPWWAHSLDAQHQLREAIVRAARGESTRFDARVQGMINEIIHVDFSLQPLCDETGDVVFLVSSASVITERKLAEQAVILSEERFRTLVAASASTAIVWTASVTGEVEGELHEWAAFTGQTFDEIRGQGWLAAVHPEDREHTAKVWCAAVAKRTVYQAEHRIRRADGEYRQMSVRGVPIFEADGKVREWVGVHSDVSDQKRLEVERIALLAQLTLQIERMPLAYLLCGPDFRFTRWNPAAEQMFGFTEEEALGKHPFDLIVPEQSQSAAADIYARLATGDMHAHGISENVTKDGRTITCEWFNTPLFDPDGVFEGIFSLAQDVSARVQAVETLRLRDRAIQATTQGILITDCGQPGDRIVYTSPWFERITGYSSEDVLGRNCRILQGPDTDPLAVAQLRKAILDEATCTVELLNYRKDSTPFWNELSIAPVRNSAGTLTHYVGVQTDVTARRKLQEQFRQAQKMDAFGQLAGGVAHDFNNLLTIINGYSELLLRSLPANDSSRLPIAQIHQAGERAAGLTHQLLAFSRQQILAPRILNLNEVVTETEKMLHRLIGEDVLLTTKLSPDLWTVRTDPGQMEQVLLNLSVNARDAMPKGGQITIETQNVHLDEAAAPNEAGARAGQHILLSVTDNGTGMSPQLKSRIFEPFFTTKGPGKGTGLGLATVFGIVNQSGGHIEVFSEVGTGTSFKVYLPRADDAAEELKIPAQIQTPACGTETVLLAEDEAGVRSFAHHVLTEHGYLVLEAADGEAAVQVADEHQGPIHLVLTDVVMPGAGGRAISEQVARRRPEVRTLFMSGYTDDAVLRHGVLREGVNFLQKPFSAYALANKVREVLDASPPMASSIKAATHLQPLTPSQADNK